MRALCCCSTGCSGHVLTLDAKVAIMAKRKGWWPIQADQSRWRPSKELDPIALLPEPTHECCEVEGEFFVLAIGL